MRAEDYRQALEKWLELQKKMEALSWDLIPAAELKERLDYLLVLMALSELEDSNKVVSGKFLKTIADQMDEIDCVKHSILAAFEGDREEFWNLKRNKNLSEIMVEVEIYLRNRRDQEPEASDYSSSSRSSENQVHRDHLFQSPRPLQSPRPDSSVTCKVRNFSSRI